MSTEHSDLNWLDQRTENLLDGMAVNRTKLARDIKRMTAELRQRRDSLPPPNPEHATGDSFSNAFDGIFSGLHK